LGEVIIRMKKETKISEQEKFYGGLNETISWIGQICWFLIVLFIVNLVLNFTFYADSSSLAPSWVTLSITIGLYVIYYLGRYFSNAKHN
jgi:hypothetical protein